ncbi:MAG: Fic family protein [Methanosarcinaceae archaeon]|nr:Fic family protein [Methanosarcinaceae archaeon]
MKIPESPPPQNLDKLEDITNCLKNETSSKLIREFNEKYLYWSELKYRKIPEQFDPELLWAAVKLNRNLTARRIKISDIAGFEFTYNQTPYIQQKLHEFDLNLGGQLEGKDIIPESEKNRYLISSIMEEAIASSQLEGAVTTRKDAKVMLRQERKPQNRSEQMILNNYITIKKLAHLKNEKLTPQLVLEIHASITKHTLDDPQQEGRFRNTNDIVVSDKTTGNVIYQPPDFRQIEKIMDEFCAFANETDEDTFIHPIIRATILHFLIGYIHPFVDGNGRTARAIFYWYLLSKGYWLIEYMSISRMIIRSPAQYSRAYLFTELDDNDLTYFINYQLKTAESAFDSLKEYIGRKIEEKSQLYDFKKIEHINDRQAHILKMLSDNPKLTFTIKEVQNRFNTVYQTARTDIIGLEELGFIEKTTSGRKKLVYYRSGMFDERVRELTQ